MPAKYHCLKKNYKEVKKLATCKAGCRRQILSKPSEDLVLSLIDLTRLILEGRVGLTKPQLRVLKKQERLLKTFVNNKVGLKEKRKLVQSGGFLGIVGALLKPVLSTLLPSVLGVKS